MDTIFVLNNHKQVIDVLSNNGSNPSAPFFDDTYKAELDTGAESYEFTTINNPRTNATLEVGNYILFKYNDKYKLFQIMETTDEHSEGKKLLTVYAEMAGMELLNDYCEPFSIEGNFITFLERVLQDTNWRVGTYSVSLLDNIQMVSSTEHKNVYSLIQENLSTFGGVEIEFRVEFIGNQLVALLIDCYEAGTRGNRTYRRFEYGEDVKGITRNRNINDLATAVIGEGKNGAHFKDIEWDKNLGNPCDKPLQQNFVVDEDANDLWNNGGKYIKTVYKSNSDDPATILQESWDYLQEIKQPKFDYDVDLALVAEDYLDINVGDTNYVVDFDYNPPILLEARVGTLELSFADSRNNKCILTNYKELVSILTQPVDFNTVGNMIQSHFPIQGTDIAMGAIGEGHINVTYYQAIKTDILSATLAEVGTLIADKADITDLTALNADIENLKSSKADIIDLNATNGNITNLNSQVGKIETIVNNHFVGTDSQVLNITAQNTTFDNAVIKNAMIDTVSANKMNTGTLNTNNVVIESEDGGVRISGATQQFKDNTGTVRVQIGKDAQGNFTFCLFSQDGTGILLDETGIKAGAVPDGLIVNDMVADNANISGGKLDISSVITSINNNTTSIKSSAIKFDDTGQTLQVAFNELKNTVDTIEEVTIQGDLSSVIEKVNTHTTQIGVMQGQISSLITNTTITKQDGTTVQLKDEYNSTKDTVNSHATKIGSLETNYNKVSGDLASVTSKQTALEQDLDGFKTTVSKTYTTKTDFNNLSIGARNLLRNSNFSLDGSFWNNWGSPSIREYVTINNKKWCHIKGTGTALHEGVAQSIGTQLKANTTYTFSARAKGASENQYFAVGVYWLDASGKTLAQSWRNFKVSPTEEVVTHTFTSPSNNNIAKANIMLGVNDSMAVYEVYFTDAKFEKGDKATDWTPAPEDIDNKFNNYSTTSEMNSAIQQKADSITSTVSKTYVTNTDFNNLSIGGKNLLRHTDFSKDNDPNSENYILNNFYASNGGTVGLTTYTFGKQSPEDEFIRNQKILRNRIDVEQAIANNQTYSMTKWVENVTLIPNTTYTLSMYMYRGGGSTSKGMFAVYPVLEDGSLGTRVCKSDELTTYEGKFVKLVKTFNTGGQSTKFSVRFYNYYDTTKTTGNSDVIIYHPMLEQGDKATAWSPAPEDIDDKFTNYSTTTEMNSAIEQKANEITSSVSETYLTQTNANKTYATKKALSEVKQTADSITSKVSSMKIGGGNLLRRTDFDDARGDNVDSIAEWHHWGSINVYTQWSPGNPTGQLRLYHTSANTSGGIYQDISVGKVPKGTQLVISYDLTKQSNISMAYMGIEYIDSSGKKISGRDFVDSSGNAKYGYQYHVFTTSTSIDYAYLRVVLCSHGTTTMDGNYVITLKNLMLEKGNTPTSWQKSYYDNEDAISEVKQTAESVTYRFNNSSQANLLPHSGVSSKNTTGWYTQGNAHWYQGHNRYLGVSNEGTTEAYAWSPTFRLGSSGWYSLHGWINVESNVKGADIFIVGTNDESTWSYDFTYHCCAVGSNTGWYHFYATFEVPSNIKAFAIRIDNNGRVDGNNGSYVVVFFGEFMLVRGKDNYPLYTDSVEGLYAGITSIDKNGVHVTHNDGSNTNLNAKALNFYDTSNRLYSQVQGGRYHFWNGSQYIGYMGHTAWADTNDQERVIVLASEYGCSTSLSSRTSSNSKYQTWVATFGKDTQVNNTLFHKGCTLTSPHLSGVFKLYGTSAMSEAYPAQIYHATDGQLAMFGDNKVAIGVMNGSELRTGIMITEDGGASNKNHMDFYGSVNMNGYSITNGNIARSVDATSAQTYALMSSNGKESYSDPTVKTITDIFPSQTPTEGEIRWTDRETHFTSEVETGVYECYIEIPWWIAQNLEDNYHINITPRNGFYQYYISENDPYYFIVRSDKDSMGFTFEIVGKLLDNNTTAHNASIASDQYGTSASEAPDIIPEFDIKEIEPPIPENETGQDLEENPLISE